MDLLIIVLIGFAIMWVLVILPQRRRAAAHKRLVSALDVGDEIVTAGGLHGTVRSIGDADLRVEVAPGVEVRLARRAVAAVVEEEAEPVERERAEEIPG